ncbi:hypothetical protein EDD53_0268 [Pacificibacter maritimus]|uniref:Oxidoreductase molybdopterin-binding domain-containing protein n=1 Tax=Pacificibacter maritimus TaxID=762213 RepID=A0A3N4VDY6_9RHOB|nr:oxidoreductase [Pacificibacter maritimus]RPE71154.1 hypothetical protein EDD53_0268 [Pacificibacter maritimus]
MTKYIFAQMLYAPLSKNTSNATNAMTGLKGIWLCALTVVTLIMSSMPVAADGPVLLSVINKSTDQTVHLTDKDLTSLPQQSFETGTTWTEGTQTYQGPSLSSVLNLTGQVDAKAQIKFTAANDYASIVSLDLISNQYPIVANRIDGAEFSVRQKGPLWIMYPFDTFPDYKSESYFSAAAWQVIKIEIIPE